MSGIGDKITEGFASLVPIKSVPGYLLLKRELEIGPGRMPQACSILWLHG